MISPMPEKTVSVAESAARAIDCGQLDLFGWERIKLGEGYAALEMLDLEAAAAVFSDLMRQKPGFPDAVQGYAMAVEWGDRLWEMEPLRLETEALALWERIRSYPFGPWGGGLRKALIKKLISVVEQNVDFYVPPDFCLGLFYIETMQYDQAEGALRRLLEKHPNNARLLCLLGNALSLQRRPSEARALYAKALLIAPRDVGAGGLEDGELAAIIREVGPHVAPIHGWLRGVLPMVDITVPSPGDHDHDTALKTYRTLVDAESARKKRDHRRMVEQRRLLKETAPEVLEAYLNRIV